MKRIPIKVLDLEANVDVPASMDEARALAPVAADGNDPLLNRVVSQVLFHQLFGDLRSGLVERIQKETTLKPASHTEKDDKGREKTIVDEKDATFVARAVAEGAVTKAQLATWLQEMCDDNEYAFGEYLKSERRHAAPKKLSKEIEQLVAAAIADGTASAKAAKLSQILGRAVDPTDPLSLGNALRDHRKAVMEQALAAAKAVFAE